MAARITGGTLLSCLRGGREGVDTLRQLGFKQPEEGLKILEKFRLFLTPKGCSTEVLQGILQTILEKPEQERVLREVEFFIDQTGCFDLLIHPQFDLFLKMVLAGPYTSLLLRRYPMWWDRIKEQAVSAAGSEPGFFERWQEFCPDPPSHPLEARNFLRQFKARETLLIAAKDLTNRETLETTLRTYSLLADWSSDEALRMSQRALTMKLGQTAAVSDEFFLVAMGKLGGLELNYSSDIDVTAFHRTDEGEIFAATGSQGSSLTPHEYFTRLMEIWVKTMADVTAEGFVHRVDLRLRPEGSRGPLVNSVRSAQNYYETWGSIWERAAYLKARPLAGNKALAFQFLHALEPFVYRRSLDFRVLEEMHQMKQRIEEEEKTMIGASSNLKLGPGGIREIEFFAQILQLIHGGREVSLRSGNTLTVLANLEKLHLIPAEDAHDLMVAYRWLRRSENLIQLYENQQTYHLPEEKFRQEQLAYLLGCESAEHFLDQTEAHRRRVRSLFDQLLQERPASPSAGHALHLNPKGQEILRLIHQGVDSQEHFEQAFQDLKKIAAIFGSYLEQMPDWRRHLKPLDELFRKIGRRLHFYQGVLAEPRNVERILSLFSQSDFLSDILLRQISLLEAVCPQEPMVNRATLSQTLATLFTQADHPTGDAREIAMNQMRIFRNRMHFRIGLGDLFEGFHILDTQHHLTALAEACVEQTQHFVYQELLERYGQPRSPEGRPSTCAIIELGTFGAGELNYTSDLDLIFVYDHAGETDGAKSISNHEFFTFFAQRLISFLTVPTHAGTTYAIDTRLRPSGNAGTLVSSREAFLRYHGDKSQLWEIQSLLRMRMLEENRAFEQSLLEDIRSLAFERRRFPNLAVELHQMKKRVEAERGRHPDQDLDLKVDRGGLMDIEFVVQFLTLKHGGPIEPHTRKALEEISRRQFLSAPHTQILMAAYDLYRHLGNRLCLVCNQNIEEIHAGLPRLDEIARTLASNDAQSLIEHLRETMGEVRKIYLDILGVSE